MVVAGIGVDDAATSGRDAIKDAMIDWFQERENGAGSHHLLRFDKLLAAPELTCRDVILHARHHHRNNRPGRRATRSEEHTSELQSHLNLVCRLLLEKKKQIKTR